MHRKGHGAIERIAPVRHRPRVHRVFREQIHRGNRVECPICERRFRHFMAHWYTENSLCWHCGSQEWHRTMWLFLTRTRPELLEGARSLLHFSPEAGIEPRLRAAIPGYVTADIDPDLADVAVDITRMDPFESGPSTPRSAHTYWSTFPTTPPPWRSCTGSCDRKAGRWWSFHSTARAARPTRIRT